MIRRLAFVGAALALAACSGEPDDPAPSPSPDKSAQANAPSEPRTLVAADLGEMQLGAKIEGPLGPEVDASIVFGGRSIGDISSFVACPAEYDTCDPADMPEGTVFTYVHTVVPGVDDPNDPPFTRPVGLDKVEAATLFSTVRKATGFTGSIGYDYAQAEKALGEDGEIRVEDDNGTLVWRVVGGDGWQTGEPITFFWQSTLPPEGPAEAYSFRADEKIAMASGPFPPKAEEKPENP